MGIQNIQCMNRRLQMTKTRRDFMSNQDKELLGNKKRTHSTCHRVLGVARPGKTAKDRWNREHKNVDSKD